MFQNEINNWTPDSNIILKHQRVEGLKTLLIQQSESFEENQILFRIIENMADFISDSQIKEGIRQQKLIKKHIIKQEINLDASTKNDTNKKTRIVSILNKLGQLSPKRFYWKRAVCGGVLAGLLMLVLMMLIALKQKYDERIEAQADLFLKIKTMVPEFEKDYPKSHEFEDRLKSVTTNNYLFLDFELDPDATKYFGEYNSTGGNYCLYDSLSSLQVIEPRSVSTEISSNELSKALNIPETVVSKAVSDWMKNPERKDCYSKEKKLLVNWPDFEYLYYLLLYNQAIPAVNLVEAHIKRDENGSIQIDDADKNFLLSCPLTKNYFKKFEFSIEYDWWQLVLGFLGYGFIYSLMIGWIFSYPHPGWKRISIILFPITGVGLFYFVKADQFHYYDYDEWAFFGLIVIFVPIVFLIVRDIFCWIKSGFINQK